MKILFKTPKVIKFKDGIMIKKMGINLLLTLFLFSCAGSIFSINTIKSEDFNEKIHDIYIVPVMKYVSDSFFENFRQLFMNKLENKKIRNQININRDYDVVENELELNKTYNWQKDLEEDIALFSPRFIMYIIMEKTRGYSIDDPASAFFTLVITDTKDKKEKWKARLHYNFGGTIVPDSAKGEKFAEIIFNILKENGLIY